MSGTLSLKLFLEPRWDRKQTAFLPPVLDDVVPEDAHVRIFASIVDTLDMSQLYKAYSGGGAPSYPPKVMLMILLFAYFEGIRSSRRIAERCRRDTHYMWLAEMSQPDFNTICRFRIKHERVIRGLFKQTVQACQHEGLVLLEHLAVDGTKIRADVSSKETYNKDRIDEAIVYTDRCIDAILQDAEAQDAADLKKEQIKEQKKKAAAAKTSSASNDDDPEHKPGPDADDDNKTPEPQSAQMTMDIEAEGKAPDPGSREPSSYIAPDKRGEVVGKLARRKQRAVDAKERMTKNKTNTECATDPDARVMNVQGLNKPAYNAQAGVDSANHVIVAAYVSQSLNDFDHIQPVLENVIENAGFAPQRVTADCGYCSVQNMMYFETAQIDGYIPPRKTQLKRADYLYNAKTDTIFIPAPDPTGEILMTFKRIRIQDGKEYRIYHSTDRKKEAWFMTDPALDIRLHKTMRDKMITDRGKVVYRQRQQIVEPVFGRIKTRFNLRRFLLRGLSGASIEFLLACSAHNIAKIITARTRQMMPVRA